jgi:predicted transcriptional regulator
MSTLSKRVSEVAEDMRSSESEMIEEALERGMKELWEQSVVKKFLKGKIDKEEAIKFVGLEKIEKAEREEKSVEEDIEWATA